MVGRVRAGSDERGHGWLWRQLVVGLVIVGYGELVVVRVVLVMMRVGMPGSRGGGAGNGESGECCRL